MVLSFDFIGGLICERPDTLMAITIEDLYRNYGILADAKDSLSQVKVQICVWSNRVGPWARLFTVHVHCFSDTAGR